MHIEWYTVVVLFSLGYMVGTVRQKRQDQRSVAFWEWAWLGLNLGATIVWVLPALWPR